MARSLSLPPSLSSMLLPRYRYALFACAVVASLFFRVPTLFTAGRFRARTRTRPLFGWPFSCMHTHARARKHARARTNDDERRDVRSVGVADWITARGGNTERTLTA